MSNIVLMNFDELLSDFEHWIIQVKKSKAMKTAFLAIDSCGYGKIVDYSEYLHYRARSRLSPCNYKICFELVNSINISSYLYHGSFEEYVHELAARRLQQVLENHDIFIDRSISRDDLKRLIKESIREVLDEKE